LNRTISERIKSALKEIPPPSVQRLARELGFADSMSLRCRFPALCNKLVAAAKTSRHDRRLEIADVLRAALVENPAPTMRMIAERLHRTDVRSLHLWFPDMCRLLADRRRAHRRSQILAAEAVLEAALAEEPPVSESIVARRIGLSPTYLAELFSATWRKLTARWAVMKKQQVAAKCEALRDEVRRIVTALCHQGLYPSRRLVKSLVVESEYRSDDVIGTEIRKVMTELGVTGLAQRGRYPASNV